MSQSELFESEGRKETYDALDALPGLAELFELSVNAYYSALYAQMSELPLKREISRFIAKAGSAGNERADAEKAAFDRGDPDVLAVLKAAGRVQHEIHRLTGLLRFSPDSNGVYIAFCTPDHYILPALTEHFRARFGESSWAVIDEKRKLCLICEKGGPANITPLPASIKTSIGETSGETSTSIGESKKDFRNPDCWEELWRLYHRSVNNEARKNPGLQRQLMPARYHKYLPEMK
jgi:probable DNA metabolism protein